MSKPDVSAGDGVSLLLTPDTFHTLLVLPTLSYTIDKLLTILWKRS